MKENFRKVRWKSKGSLDVKNTKLAPSVQKKNKKFSLLLQIKKTMWRVEMAKY